MLKVIELIKDFIIDSWINLIFFVIGEIVVGLIFGCRFRVVVLNDYFKWNFYDDIEFLILYFFIIVFLNIDIFFFVE